MSDTKRWILRIARIVVSVGLLAYLLTFIDLGETLARLANVEPIWLLTALFLLIGQTLLSALKWKLILSSGETSPSGFALWRIYLSGNFLSLFLPSSFGGDLYRVYAVNRASVGFNTSTASVLFDRFTGLFALICIGFCAYAVVEDARIAVPLVLLFLMGILVMGFSLRFRIWNRMRGLRVRGLQRLLDIVDAIATYASRWGLLAKAMLIAFAFQLNTVIINFVYCQALAIEIPLATLAVIVPVVYLTEVLPISINGIGVRDGAFVFMFAMFGYSMEDALAIAFLVLTMRYVVGFIGGLAFLADRD